ncbi:DUF3750 domain-containing protein [Modicisalibacter xianhensis]|uniref:DUF3750 domain-containing protein n=1 Tax=Modicisalibacter xianhensis TaxID=442341 RepID=A0A1I3EEK2_9GAMM|nr:DUF3750 domain-containing protein [Halomonas xianhensis]SFH97425.1 Protein of unknown function [Halomonas xianhensis]
MKRWLFAGFRSLVVMGAIGILLLGGPLVMLAGPSIDLDSHWSTADRSTAGLAPLPEQAREAIVQVYAARAFNWRGAFGVHTWIATKSQDATFYHVYEVTRWRGAVHTSRQRNPDRAWYGNPPQLLADYRGAAATQLIASIAEAAAAYPRAGEYRIWPGPNSNTFTAWVIRQVPGLRVHFPPTAIGKDYLLDGWTAETPSESGYQISLAGLFGILVAGDEGIEVNLLGLVFGIDYAAPALKLPGIGRLGVGASVLGRSADDERPVIALTR